ncbi:MAG: hypothetical protein MUC49_12580 [Raineya sp.]|jgi:hypothetical protein|nr:hypothetical protein [Raineya sp.]
MKTISFIIILFTLFIVSCKPKEEFQGVFVTGDYTGVMRYWQGEKNGMMQLANFSDSTKIAYPAYFLQINSKYGIFHVKSSETEPTSRYYILKPEFKTNDRQIFEVSKMKMTLGKGVINGEEIISPDDTKTVILEGAILKR